MKYVYSFFLITVIFSSLNAQSLRLSPEENSPALSNKNLIGYKHKTGSTFLDFKATLDEAQIRTSQSLRLTTSNGLSQMVLNTAGYLGLSSDNPQERLEIGNGRIKINGQKSITEPPAVVFAPMVPNTPTILEIQDNTHLTIKSFSNKNIFQMNTNTGNVGINTAPQATTLTVSGTIHNKTYENTTMQNKIVLANTDGSFIPSPATNLEVTAWDYTKFRTNNLTYYTINSGFGYFSVATAARPATALHFPKNARIRKITAKVIDNSTDNYLVARIYGTNPITMDIMLITSLSSKNLSNSSLAQTLEFSTFNHLVDTENLFYYVEWEVIKKSDDTETNWTSATQFGNVVIEHSQD